MAGAFPLSTRRLAALIFLILAVGLVPRANAADSQWRAQWVANPSGGTVESGQTFPVFFKAKNVGTATWYQGTVKIAALNAQEQPAESSVFWNNSWLERHRPSTLVEDHVATGEIGTFNFTMTAPEVSVGADYRDYFGPVAEGISWMYGCPEWCGAHIPVRVEPQRAPSVTITQPPPGRLKRGDPIDVTAEAIDNVGVDHVVFSLDGVEQTVTAPPYAYRFASDHLASGSHVVTVRAVDHVGLTDQKVTGFSIDRPAPGSVVINNRADFTNDRHVTLTVATPPGTTGISVSNDPDFVGAPVLPVQPTYKWQLGDSAGQRDTRIVFVRFTDPDEGDTVVFDNIILDQTKPRITRARVDRRGNRKPIVYPANALARGKCSRTAMDLRVKARDDRSGVRDLRFGFRPGALGTHVPFRSRVAVTVPPKLSSPTLYLRVRDGAGNLSSLRKVSLRGVCR